MGPFSQPAPVIFDREMSVPTRLSFGEGEAAVFSARSPEKETGNEDAACLIELAEGRGVLAVADGLGGHPGGDQASSLALAVLMESVAAAPPSEESLRAAILNGFELANEAILALGTGGGTTLAVVELAGTTIRPFHVGDSTILAVGQRGRRRLQTVMHSPVGYAMEAGLLAERDAIHHEDRHVVSNIVGTPDMRIDVGSAIGLHPRDTVVLASDGLVDNLRTEEIVEIVRKGPLPKSAATLAERCHQRMCAPQGDQPSKPDDLTFLLFRRTRSASK